MSERKHESECPECGEPIIITYDVDSGQEPSETWPAIPAHPYAVMVEQKCEHKIDADSILLWEL